MEKKVVDVESMISVIRDSVTHSSKTINTNAVKTGVRVASDRGLEIPYLCARSLVASGYPMPIDGMDNASQSLLLTARKLAGLEPLKSPEEKLPSVSPDDLSRIKEELDHAAENSQLVAKDSAVICPRLRQVLIPLPNDEGYISVVPLASAPLKHLLDKQVTESLSRLNAVLPDPAQKAIYGKIPKPRRAITPFGGSKPWNGGAYLMQMKSSYLYKPSFLEENRSIRFAFKIHYQGGQVSIKDDEAVNELREALYGEKNTMRDRVRERGILKNIVLRLLRQASAQRSLVDEWRPYLPTEGQEDGLVCNSQNHLRRGLIDLHLRDAHWCDDLAGWITKKLRGMKQAGDESFFELEDSEWGRLHKSIKDIAWELKHV